MTPVSFTVYGKPQPAGSKRAFQHRHTGRIVVTDDAKHSRPWKADVAQAAGVAMQGRDLICGPLLVEITFLLPRPKGHYGARGNVKPSAPAHPTVKPDVLKLARAVEDACTGVVWRDDAQITSEYLQKAYTTGQARCHVRVVPIRTPVEAALSGGPSTEGGGSA